MNRDADTNRPRDAREFAVLGWPSAGPTLRLDHHDFRYAGKFVMSNTGKAVARIDTAEDSDEYDDHVLAAIAFNDDRTDADTCWFRYVTVRDDLCGEGLGARLAAFTAREVEPHGYDQIRIAVNNPFAYHALHKAGFGFTGEETGLAELVLERPGPRDRETYQSGLDRYRARELSDAERDFLDAKAATSPPSTHSTEPRN